MTIKETQDNIISEFEIFNDWLDKYDYLINLGNDLPMIDPKYRTEEYIINGCQSKVWLKTDLQDGKIIFTADSDAIITKGIISLLIRVLSNRGPEEVMNSDLYFIDSIGLRENLSPTRANGLLAMTKKMKLYALAYYTMQKKG